MDTEELKVDVTEAVIPFKPRQLTYGPEPPPLTEVILNANVCDGFGLTQYKFISDYDKDPEKCPVPEAESLSDKVRTIRKMEPKVPAFPYVQVAISSESNSLVPNQQSVSQMNMNINIADYFEFLKAQGIPVLPELPPLKLLQPTAPIDSEQQLAPLSKSVAPLSDAESSLIPITPDVKQSPYAAGGDMAIYSENGTDFQQISFIPAGQDQEVTLLFPVSMPRAAVLMPQSKEEFAQSFIHMLGVKEEMAEGNKDTKWRNKLSALLFKCIMSLVLGYLYNHVKSYITNFATLDALSSVDADELGMLIIQSEIDSGLFQESDYKTLSIRLDYLKTLFMKQGVASPALKSLFNIPANNDLSPEQHYETIFEMVYRLGQMPIELELESDKWSYASILQNVCSKIYIILLNYDVITAAIGDKAAPIINAFIDFTDTSETATIFKRLKSIIVLGVAYNSYGWLFALVAPFAIPAAIGVTNWAICTLARLPFKAIKYAGNSAIGIVTWLVSDGEALQSNSFTPGQDGSLICVGHTRTKTGLGPEDYALVPYLVSMNDVHALSHELQHAKVEKASLISSLFDASGAAGLDMQSDTKEGDALRFFKETHPIGNLIKCIDSEIIALTNTDEIGVVKLFPEIAFSVFFNTICKDEEAKNGLLIGPVMQFWAESLHEAISGVRSGVIETIRAILEEGLRGQNAIQHGTDSPFSTPTSSPPASPTALKDELQSQSPLSSASSCDSFTTAKSSASIDTADTNGGLSFLEIDNSEGSLQIIMAVQLMPKLTQLEKLLKKSTPSFTMKEFPVCALSRNNSAASDASADSEVSALSNGSVTSNQLMAEIKIKLVNVRALNEEAVKINAELNQAIKEHLQLLLVPHTNIIVESVLDWIKKLSPFRGGFKRHRNVPILAEIKQKIVNTGSGLFNAIKPRLVRVKGRKSKRFAPKKGTKKWRKRYGSRRGTKKVYRKRYNTHKKRK
jgi:hypothetical protein